MTGGSGRRDLGRTIRELLTVPLPPLTDAQRQTLGRYADELARLNRRVNLVAQSTMGDVWARHVRHSLCVAARPFPAGAVVVDWGTGGGLPAVPLAVACPHVQVVAVDSIAKKTEAVRLFARRLGIDNLTVWTGRAEAYDGPAPHYAVSRATAPLADLWGWFAAARAPFDGPLPDGAWTPGLVCLKGGDLADERAALDAAFPGLAVTETPLDGLLGAGWADKALVHVFPRTAETAPARSETSA